MTCEYMNLGRILRPHVIAENGKVVRFNGNPTVDDLRNVVFRKRDVQAVHYRMKYEMRCLAMMLREMYWHMDLEDASVVIHRHRKDHGTISPSPEFVMKAIFDMWPSLKTIQRAA